MNAILKFYTLAADVDYVPKQYCGKWNNAIIREGNTDKIIVEMVNIIVLILSVMAPMQTSTDLWIPTF